MFRNEKLIKNLKLAQNTIESDCDSSFNKIYSFTTENISGYIDSFDLINKSLLTVGSSGDQALNAILNGCSDITLFDINPFTKYYFNLKKAAILTLGYDQFIDYLSEVNFSAAMFNVSTYQKLRPTLSIIDLESLMFWDELYKKNNHNIIRYRLFQDEIMEHGLINNFNKYLTKPYLYKLLRDRIKNVSPCFINGNIIDLNKIIYDKKFDNIILSNIFDYFKSSKEDLYNFRFAINDLYKFLNPEGKMMIAYLYGIDTNNSLEEFNKLKLEDTMVEKIRGVRGYYYNDDTKDCVVTYRKVK